MRVFGWIWLPACVVLGLALTQCPAAQPLPAPGTGGRYAVLTATPHRAAPFGGVDVVFGPREIVGGVEHQWWQLEVREKESADAAVMFQVRALTRQDPLRAEAAELHFARYMLRTAEAKEPLEYRSAVTGGALLPPWRHFRRYFVPRRARDSGLRNSMPETCRYLGHVLTLRHAGNSAPWKPWKNTKVLPLDPEMLVGTGRSFRDTEGRRLPQKPKRQNYSYTPFVAADYAVMIQAGINLFTVKAAQQKHVRAEPVFYLRPAAGSPPLRYPADLYRSNYLGSTMFMDEPTIIMVGDKLIHDSLRYFSDAAALIAARVRGRYNSSGGYGAFRLEAELARRGVSFGDMRLMQHDYPAWETIFETAHYQLAGGLAGIVHEGRYQLKPFDEAIARWTGRVRRHTGEELLRYHFAHLRGAARRFGKSWGTSIYGQCDPEIAKRAVTLAYDMGARYVWFWTSDHGHHMPWPEQLALARRLKAHTRAHRRKSILGPPPVLDTAIVVPRGYFLSLRNLWWVRVLDPAGKGEAAGRYRRLMQRAMRAYHEALDRKERFDFVIAGEGDPEGYRKTVRLSDK